MRVWLLAACAAVSLSIGVAHAGDVNVRGYYRSNGTYVAPHVRSAPNSYRSDNYGRPSASDRAFGVAPGLRDYDHDGVPNRLDADDDNDGIGDDFE